MLRDPRRRLASAFNHYLHSVGMPTDMREQMLATVKSVGEYAHYPGISGCQTKMLLGLPCARPIGLTQRHVSKAIRRLQSRFAFVGITDEWDASVCLFHAMFGGAPDVTSFQNIRPAADFHNETGNPSRNLAKDEELMPEDDPLDWQLYQAAVRIFRANQRRFGHPQPVVQQSR